MSRSIRMGPIMLILFLFVALTQSAVFSPNTDVVLMDATLFERVIRSDRISVILFFQEGCDHCKKFSNTFEKFSRLMKDIVNVGAIDVDQYKFLGSYYDIKGVPTVKIFAPNVRSQIFNKDREVKSLITATFDVVKTELIYRFRKAVTRAEVTLNYTDINVEKMDDLIRYSRKMWVVLVYTKACLACDKIIAKWHKMHEVLRENISFGVLDGASSYKFLKTTDVLGYPSLRFYVNQTLYTNYIGDMYLDEMIQWANSSFKENSSLTYQPQSIRKLCDLSPFCVISILPDEDTCHTTCQNKLYGILHNGIKQFKLMDWSWAWFRIGISVDLDTKFLINLADDIPTLFFINMGNGTLRKSPYSFDETGNFDFLSTVNNSQHAEQELPISFWKLKEGIF